MLAGIGSDFRYVLRVLRRSPGFTVVAVLSLAIGIGANTSMFGVVRTLLLTPLPVRAPEELRLVTWHREGEYSISQTGSTSYEDPETGLRYQSNFSYPMVRAMRASAPAGVDLFAFGFVRGVSVAVGNRPAFLAGGAMADGSYFDGLGAPMALGRPLGVADDVEGAPMVAVLSHDFWMRAYGGDPAAIGSTVRVNGIPAEVVGVTGAGFRGLSMGGFFPQTEVTVPVAAQPIVFPRISSGSSLFTAENNLWLRLMARVPDEASLASVQMALQAAMVSVPSELLGGDGYTPNVRLLPGAQGAQPIRAETGRLLFLLLGVVGMVLLIACVNLASLMLARGVSRQREMAVRRALGGARLRIVRQALLESLVIAGVGTTFGLVLSISTRGLLGGLLTGSLGAGAFGNEQMRVDVDPELIGLGVLLGVTATLFFGLVPALRLSGLDPIEWLRQRAPGASTPRLTAGRALIALQIAVSVPLVIGAALFLRTAHNLAAVELGFDPRGLIAFQVDPGHTRLSTEEYPRLYTELLAAVEEVPGVSSATLIENVVMSGITSNNNFTVDGQTHLVYQNAVGPAVLETMGMRLIAGRMPGLQDDLGAPRVGVVNETAVRVMFGGESPIGRLIGREGREGLEVQIVGIVNDVPYRSARQPVPPTLYESALQRNGYGGHNIVLRTDVPPARIEPLIREAVYRVDPDIPVPELRAQTEVMAQTSARERVFTQLLTLFGGFALLLASIGLYGVTSYSVTRRTSEIGVRVAVGARPGQILGLVLRQVVVLAAIGLAVGIPVALAAGPLVGSLLYGVAPTDPVAILAAAAIMMTVAVGAGLLPALRAARLDALVALRAE